MAVNLTTLFTRLGALIDYGDKIATQQAVHVTEVDDVLDEYANDRDIAVALQNGLNGYIAGSGSALATIGTVVRDTIIEMVHDDDPLPVKDLPSAFKRLAEQMTASSDSIDGTTVSASVAAVAGAVGNGKIVVSLVDEEGNATQYVRAEDIVLECTRDAQESGTAGQETFSVAGEERIGNLEFGWPDGSGMGGTLVLTDCSVDAGSGPGKNMGTNTDFETFSGNTPGTWTIDTGTAGTQILKTTTALRGTNALSLVGDAGGTLTKISQSISGLKPNRKYCIGFWVRDDGTGPAAGVLRVSLKDSGGNIYNASTSLTDAAKSVDLTAVGSTYAFQSVAFETPTDLPTGAVLTVELTTALTNTRAVFIDEMFIAEMYQFGGLGGPYMIGTPGSTDHIRTDRFIVTITNNNEGQFVRGLDKYLGLYELGLYLPSDTAGGETIDDALVA